MSVLDPLDLVGQVVDHRYAIEYAARGPDGRI